MPTRKPVLPSGLGQSQYWRQTKPYYTAQLLLPMWRDGSVNIVKHFNYRLNFALFRKHINLIYCNTSSSYRLKIMSVLKKLVKICCYKKKNNLHSRKIIIHELIFVCPSVLQGLRDQVCCMGWVTKCVAAAAWPSVLHGLRDQACCIGCVTKCVAWAAWPSVLHGLRDQLCCMGCLTNKLIPENIFPNF